MTSSPDYFPRDRGQRRLVRLLFLAVAVYFVLGEVARRTVGEVYPSLVMPSFGGVGLVSMTDHDGETYIAHFVITFSDQTTAEVTPWQFSGPFYPSVLMVKFFTHDTPTTYRPIDATQVAFIADRVRKLFPGKTPVKATIVVDLIRFPLDQPNQRTVVAQTAQRDIVFP